MTIELFEHPKQRRWIVVEERSAQDEVRILRRVFNKENRKNVKNDVVHVDARLNGLKTTVTVTTRLLEIPQPDTSFATDMEDLVKLAQKHAYERCERLGYTRVLGVYFDGKTWSAKLQM